MNRSMWGALCIAVLGACSDKKVEPPPAPAPDLAPARAVSDGTLRLLVWEGYADPAVIKSFEGANHIKVEAKYMTSSDDLLARLRAKDGPPIDVISPSSDVAATIAVTGLAIPLDLSKIPSYAIISPQLTALRVDEYKGKVYGAPFLWGANLLLYDTTVFPKAPDSWNVLADPKYKGKVALWDDLSSIYMGAELLGFDKDDKGYIYNLNDDKLAQVKARLLTIKPNLKGTWQKGADLTKMFQDHQVVAAMGWPLTAKQLRIAKFPIGETIPKEGTTGWVDHLMITSVSPNVDLAHKLIEYLLQAKTQKALIEVTGYLPANPQAVALMSEEEKTNLHMGYVDAYYKVINFWEDVPRRDKYVEVWKAVQAAH